MSTELTRRLFTVEEYHRMADAGILTEDDRVELLDGEIVQMSRIGSHHAGTVNRLTRLLVQRLGSRAVVTVQNPVVLDDRTEPARLGRRAPPRR
jgi:Uma2 family endonuclease